MQIHLKALDDKSKIFFEGSASLDPVALIAKSESSQDLARAKGRQFAEGAVPFFASKLIKAAMQGQGDDELHDYSIMVAKAAWVAGSIYGGLSAAEFVNSNLHFTLLPSGEVKFERMNIG